MPKVKKDSHKISLDEKRLLGTQWINLAQEATDGSTEHRNMGCKVGSTKPVVGSTKPPLIDTGVRVDAAKIRK